jgi:acetyltransferase
VLLGEALTRIHATDAPANTGAMPPDIDQKLIAQRIKSSEEGYLDPQSVQVLLDAAGIPRVKEGVARDEASLFKLAHSTGFPLAMKVVGPIHKSDVGGVVLGIDTDVELMEQFERLSKIDGCTGVLIQPMFEGTEIFAGAKYEPGFGHLVLCGIGGIYVEVLRDMASGLAPLSISESQRMIGSLRGIKMLEGMRGQPGINLDAYADILIRLSWVLKKNPEIVEMDLNPIMGREEELAVVDARIRISK